MTLRPRATGIDRRTLLTVPLLGAGALAATAAASGRAVAASARAAGARPVGPAGPSAPSGADRALLRRWAADTWRSLDAMTVRRTGLISDSIDASLVGHSRHTLSLIHI